MKLFLSLILALAAVIPSTAHATAIGDQEFTKVVYLQSAAESPTPKATNSGRDYGSALPLATGNIFAVPKNVIVTNVFAIVDEAVAGVTAFNVGDEDGSTGFIASSAPSGTLAALGMAYWDVDYKGSYLKGGSVVANHMLSKFYSVTGKHVALSITGTASLGKMRVFIKGYAVPGL